MESQPVNKTIKIPLEIKDDIFPDEKITHIEHFDLKEPFSLLDPLEALMRLTKAEGKDEIGKNGPPMAAVATEENSDNHELRLYETLFGRDSLIVSAFLLKEYPRLARATILALAKLQGITTDPRNEEEPGKIMHEYRDPHDPVGIMLCQERGWAFPYYGSVDATPLFAKLIIAYSLQEGLDFLFEEFTDRSGKVSTVLKSFDNAVNFILRRIDTNAEGFLEYLRVNPNGLKNQVWKDSNDSYSYKDGTLPDHKHHIASIEVQGYVYDILLGAAELYQKINQRKEKSYTEGVISDLKERAARLKETIIEKFWIEDERGGYFAQGSERFEGGIKIMEIRGSNMGHLLNSRFFNDANEELLQKRDAMVKTLLSDEFKNASGIRTLSNREKRFRSGSYHNGSVWLWDTYMIALGLKRQGFTEQADDLIRRILGVVLKFKKYPEFAKGDAGPNPLLNEYVVDVQSELDGSENRIEQPPQEIQAWTVAAVLHALTDPMHLAGLSPKETIARTSN